MKIAIYKSNIIDNDTINKGIAMVQDALIGLPTTITTTATSHQFSVANYATGTMNDPQEILDIADKTSDVAFLLFNNPALTPNPLHTNIKQGNCTPCQMSEQWYFTYPEVFRDYFLHELCHALYYLTGTPNDMTHLMNDYNSNPQLYDYWVKYPIYQYYLSIINTLLPKLKYPMKTAILKRTIKTNYEFLGDFATDGFSCKTLERPWLNNMRDVSCIPEGSYLVKWVRTLKHPLGIYQLQNVPGRSGIEIHSGNYFFDVNGCILLGTGYEDINSDKKTDIVNSKVTVNAFNKLMNKQDFTLIVK